MKRSVKGNPLTVGIMVWSMVIFMNVESAMALAIRQGNTVRVVGSKSSWQLSVNGRIFPIKGVGVGRAVGKDGVDYLKMAKELGANTVRTWGVDQGDQHYLDTASKYGLYIDAGIWLHPVWEGSTFSYRDENYQKEVRNEFLGYVRRYRNHPAVIFWNIGNETIYWMKDEEERIAFCHFLEQLIQDVHRIDPNHPVVYTSSAKTDIPYLKKYVPSLDIVGINAYGGLDQLHKEFVELFDIPYLITEFGSVGEWSSNKDTNGVSFELSDESKMIYYKQHSHLIKTFKGYCLGAFVFYLGDTTQVSLTWWNINYREKKKYSFMVMEDFYKDRPYRRAPFVVKDLVLKKYQLNPSEEIEISVQLKNVLNPQEPIEYSYMISTASEAVLIEYPNEMIAQGDMGQSSVFKINAPNKPGIYRVYAVASQGNYASVFNKSIRVTTKQETLKN